MTCSNAEIYALIFDMRIVVCGDSVQPPGELLWESSGTTFREHVADHEQIHGEYWIP